ncbi:MAG TPA: ATP-binding protein [Baekduia sp.]|nr:ATP-binding protein [Baekduia sp.]
MLGATMQPSRTQQLRLPAQPPSISALRAAAREWAAAAGLGDSRVADVALAVSEAATNAVLHGFVDRQPGSVTLRLEAREGRAVFRVSDDGRGFAPRFDSPGLGLGVPTIGRLADHFDVGPGPEGGTEVRMSFEAPGLASGDALRRRLDGVYGELPDAVTVSDADGQIVYANAAAVELLGFSDADDLLRQPAGAAASHFRMTLADGSPVGLEDLPHRRLLSGDEHPGPLLTRSVHLPTGRARWLLTTAAPLEDEDHRGRLAVSVVRDVTATTEAEHRARFLAEAMDRLATAAVDLTGTFRAIADLAVPELADWCAVDVAGEGVLHRVALAHRDPEKVALGWEIHERWPPDPARDDGPYGVLRTGDPLVIPFLDPALLATVADPEHRAALLAIGMRSIVVAPMTGRGEVVGTLTLVTSESARVFDDEAIAFALDVARRAGLAVDNARRIGGG